MGSTTAMGKTAKSRTLAVLCGVFFAISIRAQEGPHLDGLASPMPPLALQGAGTFRTSCGFCHGSDAGGAQGPNLTASSFFTPDDHGAALAEFLKSGRPNVGMPPFPTLSPADVDAIYAFVRYRRGT